MKENSKIKILFKNHEILMFYLIGFLITWIGWFFLDMIIKTVPSGNGDVDGWSLVIEEGRFYLIFLPFLSVGAVWGPNISAFIVLAINDGKPGVKALLKKVINWRVAIPWYCAAISIPIIIKYSMYIFNATILGGSFVPDFQTVFFTVILLQFFNELIPSGGQEEIAWSGFAQTKLQEKFSVINATLIKGFLGWVWHLPLFLLYPWGGCLGEDIWIFLSFYMGLAFIYTWLFNNTNSVLLPAIFHATFNTTGTFAIVNSTSNLNAIISTIVFIIVIWFIVIILFISFGKNLTRKSLPTLELNF